MPTRFHHLADDERGMSLIFLGVCMTAFIGTATLAIDVGMFLNARTQTPPWDPNDTFEMYDNHGNLMPDRDVYFPARNCLTCRDNTGYTGYTVARDKGTQLVLRAGTGTNINPSFYYSWKMPGDTGGSF